MSVDPRDPRYLTVHDPRLLQIPSMSFLYREMPAQPLRMAAPTPPIRKRLPDTRAIPRPNGRTPDANQPVRTNRERLIQQSLEYEIDVRRAMR
jgi:hypothetical protein